MDSQGFSAAQDKVQPARNNHRQAGKRAERHNVQADPAAIWRYSRNCSAATRGEPTAQLVNCSPAGFRFKRLLPHLTHLDCCLTSLLTNLWLDNAPGLINFRTFPYEVDQGRTNIKPENVCEEQA